MHAAYATASLDGVLLNIHPDSLLEAAEEKVKALEKVHRNEWEEAGDLFTSYYEKLAKVITPTE